MTFSEWLKAQPGRASAAARHFNVTASAISQWAAAGVPTRRMRAVQAFTAGEVSLDDMVPPAAEADGALRRLEPVAAGVR